MVVPFIADGLARDQPVMVAVPQPRLHALRDALGGDAEKVAWTDMA
ncbi:MAG: sensor histidine kinase, partial [Mycobacterium sp.]